MAKADPGRDAALLLDMVLAARDARGFLSGVDKAAFLASALHQSAVIRKLEVIGEAAGRVSTELRAKHAAVPWREIIGMRHRLIHGYDDIDLDTVYAVVRDRLGPLIAALEPLIPKDQV